MDFVFEGKTLRKKTGTLIPVTADTPAAQDIVALAKPYEAAAQRYLDTPVGTAPRELSNEGIAAFINRVQLEASHAEVSLTAALDPSLRIAKGPVTLRQITAIYPYENDLYVIEAPARVLQGISDVVSGAVPGPPDRVVRIVLNSYRATQGPFRDFKPVWKSSVGIRDLLVAAMK
jgi:2',3'-cyclic-nucleotide 2'-phosphodiesterase (5'-nucleotidase family)